MSNRYRINFDCVPQIGTRVQGWSGVWLTLVAVAPWTRVDGSKTHLLQWRADDGRMALSGLRARSPKWETIAEARARRAEVEA